MNCEFHLPGRILFGCGERRGLPGLLAPGNVLIVTGRHSRRRVEAELLPALEGRTVRLVSDASPEPPIPDVERIIAAGREIDAGCVIGWGGGSAIDAAKTAAALMRQEGSVADYFYGRRKIGGKGCFFAALPTTAGTGAEITPNAVLTDPETGIKQSIRHDTMFADVAIVDPELTWDCPPGVTAASGFDALTQGNESYLSKKANVASEALALKAAADVFTMLLPAVRESAPPARTMVAEGSMLAAMAFAQSGLGSVHGIGHPLGSLLHVPHGVCCAILLPALLRRNLPACREKMEVLAGMLVQDSAEAMIAAIEELRRAVGLPENFSRYGLKEEHFDFIVKNCRSGSMKSNPRDFSDDEVRMILKELMG